MGTTTSSFAQDDDTAAGLVSTERLADLLRAVPTFTLVDAKGPHGFSLHYHAQVGQEDSKAVLDYLQSVKEVELKPLPAFMRRKKKQ